MRLIITKSKTQGGTMKDKTTKEKIRFFVMMTFAFIAGFNYTIPILEYIEYARTNTYTFGVPIAQNALIIAGIYTIIVIMLAKNETF